MQSDVIEVIGRFVEVEPGVFQWEGAEPDRAIRLWRPAGRYHLLDGTVADHPRISVAQHETSDDEVVGASAIGALLTLEGFMAAWQGLTREQRREAARTAGDAARTIMVTLTRARNRRRPPRLTRTPGEQEV